MTPLKQRERDVTRALLEKQIISTTTHIPAINNFDKEKKTFKMVRDNSIKTGEELEEGWRSYRIDPIEDVLRGRGLRTTHVTPEDFPRLINIFK